MAKELESLILEKDAVIIKVAINLLQLTLTEMHSSDADEIVLQVTHLLKLLNKK